MSDPKIPTLTLHNGVRLPALGFGVFQTPPDETIAAVEEALRVGYRHIDTAAAYGNEREVGEAIRRSEVDRADLVVETKVWASDYGYDETLHAFEKASAKLGLEQLDILILHQVAANLFDRTIDAYRALERLLAEGRVRAIGVSNFPVPRLTQLIDATEVVPHLNQVELHPYFSQPELQDFHREQGILTQAWSPIGGITFYPGWGGEDRRSTLADPTIGEIAAAHGRTPAQVMLRWHLQQGRSAIPKSVTPSRIAENLAVTDFVLSDAQLAAIDALDTGTPGGPEPERDFDDRQLFPIPEA
ncbi:aldo/keto reductase [Nocardioides insulae]|uniref:aldo/keto reductase n=1 Tax=Nocardioides insulae TaxID=394734 RepID=UPI0004915F27|nr:aldo/keto reductase [Nocardioides insulae]